LNHFDRAAQTFTHYTMKDGLPDDAVYGILPDAEGRLWLSTNRGLSRFDPRQGSFRNYDSNDGLQGDQFNVRAYSRGSDGELFFGGTRGFNAFFPEQITDNLVPPLVVITAFDILNQTVRTNHLIRVCRPGLQCSGKEPVRVHAGGGRPRLGLRRDAPLCQLRELARWELCLSGKSFE
jgi:hypothetical protein